MDALKDWTDYRLKKAAFPEAAERGRLLAATRMADDLEARKRVEDAYGAEFCRKMYPEAYQSGHVSLIRRLWDAIPW